MPLYYQFLFFFLLILSEVKIQVTCCDRNFDQRANEYLIRLESFEMTAIFDQRATEYLILLESFEMRYYSLSLSFV
jgi:hypothetical protein